MQPDVLIIGAGPAGTSAAAILTEHGHRVLVLEREQFPRYHVGESMVPFTYQPLQRLGLIPQMKASHFVKKYSVQFVEQNGQASHPLYFFSRFDRDTVAQTWQVLRSEFDQMLADNARAKGARIVENIAVKELIEENGRITGVRAQGGEGRLIEHRARLTLDCSGKEAFAATRLGWRIKDPQLNKVAVWTYYRGAGRAAGLDAGATTIAMLPEQGWFWHIPLQDDMVSVGLVAEGRYLRRDGCASPATMFAREIKQNPWMERQLALGQQVGPHYVTSEYTYHARHCSTDGLLLAGDAFCFLDPVFSSGLMLALKSGVLAGDTVHEALLNPDGSTALFSEYGQTMRRGIENMRKLVHAFYNENFTFTKLISRHLYLAGDVTDFLAGDVDRDFTALWKAVSELAPLPEELPCGGPLVRRDA